MTLPPAGMAPASRSRRAVVEAAGVGLVVVVAHLLLRLSGAFAVGALNDDGVYVALGKAIAEGDGYRSIYLAGAPLHLRYPPGFPLLLALPWALGGTLAAVRATVAALHPLVAGAAAGLVWWTGRRQLELAPASLALCAVAPFLLDPLIQYFNIPLTEPYLVLGWAGVLVLTPPLLDPPAADAVPWAGALAVGLLLAATTLFRAVGVALIPAVLLALAIHRRWKAAAVCAAAVVVPLLLWEALRAHWLARGPVSSQPDDLSYWRWLGVNGPLALAEYAGRTAFRNGVEYVRKLADYLFPIESVGIVVVLAAAAAAAAACVRMWRSHTALVLTTLASAALTLVWPFAQGRLLLPLLPFLGLLVASSVEVGVRRTPARVRWALPAALALAAVVVTLRQSELRDIAARSYASGVLPPPRDLSPTLTLAVRSRFIYQTAGWVRAHTASRDRIMVDAPAAVYLYTNRRTVPASPTESRLGTSAFAVPGGYLAGRILADSVSVVVWAPPAPELERDILTIQARCPDVLQRDSTTSTVAFRVRRDEGCLRERVLAVSDAMRAARP